MYKHQQLGYIIGYIFTYRLYKYILQCEDIKLHEYFLCRVYSLQEALFYCSLMQMERQNFQT